MSVGDLLDDYFELDGLKGSTASSGVVGVWAGPRTPGTAYNLLHHALGECGGIEGAWGQVIGGMGAISKAMARSAESAGAEIRTGAEVASIDVRNGAAIGVTLADGTELRAPIVASGAHPKTTVLDLAGSENFPTEVAEDMERYRTRGASVKVNLVLSEPPVYEGVDRRGAAADAHGGREHLPLDRLPRARLAGRDPRQAGRASLRRGGAAVGGRHHAHRRRPLGDDDVHPVRAVARRIEWKPGDRERYGDTCIEQLSPVRAQPARTRSSSARCWRRRTSSGSSASQGGSIFQGEQGLDQMAFMRPHPEMAQYATPVDGLYLCGAGTHPGGGVTGCSGHNAAHRILKDRKRARRPWRRAQASA